MRSAIFSALCINLHILSGHAFTTPSQTVIASRRTFNTAIGSTVESSSETTPSPPSSSSEATTPSPANKNKPTWEVKQHLYGLDMVNEAKSNSVSVTVGADGEVADGGALPLPQTYITCGKCKSLFAVAEADLGDKGKGCRVKCSVCGNSWYQSRDRLFDIPTESHDLLPANKSDLDRVARNLARDQSPNFMGVYKLYVGNLDFRTTADELLDFFETNAKKTDGAEGEKIAVCDVSVVTGPDGRARGFAFVSFYDENDGKAALECDGLECNGRELSVREPNN